MAQRKPNRSQVRWRWLETPAGFWSGQPVTPHHPCLGSLEAALPTVSPGCVCVRLPSPMLLSPLQLQLHQPATSKVHHNMAPGKCYKNRLGSLCTCLAFGFLRFDIIMGISVCGFWRSHNLKPVSCGLQFQCCFFKGESNERSNHKRLSVLVLISPDSMTPATSSRLRIDWDNRKTDGFSGQFPTELHALQVDAKLLLPDWKKSNRTLAGPNITRFPKRTQ